MARDAAMLQRERQVEQALADYFQHTDDAEAIRRQAQQRAAKLLADAETASREPETFAAIAVRILAQLGETRASISERTGRVRTQRRDMPPHQAATHRVQPARRNVKARPGPYGTCAEAERLIRAAAAVTGTAAPSAHVQRSANRREAPGLRAAGVRYVLFEFDWVAAAPSTIEFGHS